MRCPKCGCEDSKVIDSRSSEAGTAIRRRRECLNPACAERFTTYERREETPIQVRKKDGTLESRIRPTLENGSVVTDARPCAHWFVTEYGKVNLKGLTAWQRAEALISVAHPDFREQLIQEAEKMRIWKRSNKR